MKLTRPPPSWAHSHSSTVENLPGPKFQSSLNQNLEDLGLYNGIWKFQWYLLQVERWGKDMNSLRCEYCWWVWRAPSWQFSFQARMQWFLCQRLEKTCENGENMWKWCKKYGEMVKLEIGEINWHWSDLHVCKLLQQDQQWNKLVKFPVNHEKLLEYPSMKRSNPSVSDTAKRFSWCSVSSCEMSGSGVLLLECTMWRQSPSTSSRSPTRSPPILSRSFNIKGESSAKAKLGYGKNKAITLRCT